MSWPQGGDYFIHADWRLVLDSRRLHGIDDWLALDKQSVDRPNHRWGGEGEVYRCTLIDIDGRPQQVYIKHQRDQRRRSLRHPLLGEPTYRREFRNLMRCHMAGVPVAEPLYFRNVRRGGHDETLLVVRGLDGHQSLDRIKPARLPPRRRWRLIRDVAAAVAVLHGAGYTHQNLYAKHIFVAWRESLGGFDVRFIDLEKCRRHRGRRHLLYRDLETLARYCRQWSASAQLHFLRHYLGGGPLGEAGRTWARAVHRAAQRKQGA